MTTDIQVRKYYNQATITSKSRLGKKWLLKNMTGLTVSSWGSAQTQVDADIADDIVDVMKEAGLKVDRE
jgi:hypothetical protein